MEDHTTSSSCPDSPKLPYAAVVAASGSCGVGTSQSHEHSELSVQTSSVSNGQLTHEDVVLPARHTFLSWLQQEFSTNCVSGVIPLANLTPVLQHQPAALISDIHECGTFTKWLRKQIHSDANKHLQLDYRVCGKMLISNSVPTLRCTGRVLHTYIHPNTNRFVGVIECINDTEHGREKMRVFWDQNLTAINWVPKQMDRVALEAIPSINAPDQCSHVACQLAVIPSNNQKHHSPSAGIASNIENTIVGVQNNICENTTDHDIEKQSYNGATTPQQQPSKSRLSIWTSSPYPLTESRTQTVQQHNQRM